MECLKIEILDIISEFANIDREVAGAKIIDIFSRYEIKKIIDPEATDILSKIDSYLNAKKVEGLSSQTLTGYKQRLTKFAKMMRKNINDVTTNDCRAFIASYDHHKQSSISTIISTLKSFFGWLYEEEFINRDVTRKIKSPKKEKLLPKAFNIIELEIIKESCKTYRERALVELFYATGCRLSEITQLNKNDLNLIDGKTTVFGKGSKERTVYLSEKSIYHLKKYLMSRTDDNEALFVGERAPHKRIGNRSIQAAFKKIADRTDKHIHPHKFRHTFATMMINNGADITTIQHMLGHSSPATTQGYAVVNEKTKHDNYLKYHIQ